MSLNLKPVDYLWMLKEEHAEFTRHPAFVRKAIICCALSNALPEIIFAEYGSTEPHKVQNATSQDKYRDYLRGQCQAHHTVRDICDFSKHGPKLNRPSVSVTDAKLIRRVESFLFGLFKIPASISVAIAGLLCLNCPALIISAVAQQTTANDVVIGCKAFVEDQITNAQLAHDAGFCSGIVHGLAGISKYLSPPGWQSCVPPTSDARQLARVIVKYIEERPQRMHESFRVLVLEAFHNAWPCKSGR